MNEYEVIEVDGTICLKMKTEQFVQLMGMEMDEFKEDYSSIKELIDHNLGG